MNLCNLCGKWVLEWSESQGAFHVGEAHEQFGLSLRACIEGSGHRSDWITLGMFPTQQDALEAAAEVRAERERRQTTPNTTLIWAVPPSQRRG